MNDIDLSAPPAFGSPELRLPDELRAPLKKHLAYLREQYRKLRWAGRVGFGERPALVVIDLALKWTKPASYPLGSNIDSVIAATRQVVDAARHAGIPVFFTTYDFDPAEPPSPHDRKIEGTIREDPDASLYEIDPRLERRPSEKIVRKKYASALRATNLEMNLAALGIDTLIVTGVSTSHCVYATCRDAAHTYRVIVPREAVGERCEIMHEVNLLDIEIDLGDVLPVADVVSHLRQLA
jgi:nicotinamidase-related amidase